MSEMYQVREKIDLDLIVSWWDEYILPEELSSECEFQSELLVEYWNELEKTEQEYDLSIEEDLDAFAAYIVAVGNFAAVGYHIRHLDSIIQGRAERGELCRKTEN